jgi:hypothetical protein
MTSTDLGFGYGWQWWRSCSMKPSYRAPQWFLGIPWKKARHLEYTPEGRDTYNPDESE